MGALDRAANRIEFELEQLERRQYPTPGAMTKVLDASTVQTPALDLLDEKLVAVARGELTRLIWSMPPQEGKSERVSRRFPLWMLCRNPDLRIGITSYELNTARRWGRRIRNDVAEHPELGLRVRSDTSAAQEWQLDGHRGGVYSVGIGGALTGRPLDCFPGDTRIVSEHGYRSVRDLYLSANRPRVLSFNHRTGRAEWRRIIAARAVPDRPLVEVVTDAGRRFTCTPDHRVYIADGYRPAALLRRGDRLIVGRTEHAQGVRGLRQGTQEQRRNVPELPYVGQGLDLCGLGVQPLPCCTPQVSGDTVSLVRHLHGIRDTVYDLQVEGNNNFFAEEVLVHNCLIIDDPVKGRAEADSETYREDAWEFWTETARTRLAPGAPVVIIMTRWHEDDLAGRLITQGGWTVVNVPAQCETDDDILGRAHGEYLESARGRTPEQWLEIRRDVGERGWTALYQGRPAPSEGGMLKRAWWRYDNAPAAYAKADGTMVAHGMDVVVQSWDMAFKDTKSSDYVVGQVWGRRGAEVHLLDQVRDRLDFPATCRAVQAMTAKWPQATLKLIEDKANGPAVIAQLRQQVPGMVPINPKDSKAARVAAVSPFVEAGNVFLPEASRAPWVAGFVEESAAFPNSANDDQVDAMTQAISRLLLDGSPTGFLDALVTHMAG